MELPYEVDVLVLGSGLAESMVACAAAMLGNSVLVLEPGEHYGSAFPSFNLDALCKWADSKGEATRQGDYSNKKRTDAAAGVSLDPDPSGTRSPAQIEFVHSDSVFSNVCIDVSDRASLGPSRLYSFDLAHQALQALGPCVHAVRAAGIHAYTDFVAVTSAWVWNHGKVWKVPDSIRDVHELADLSPAGKRALWLFMQQAEQAATGSAVPLASTQNFAAALQSLCLPQSMQDALLYVALNCQKKVDAESYLPGRQALEAIASYSTQGGAYVDGQAPYVECSYGCSELAQGFVRACCVHGGMVALQTPPDSIRLDRDGEASAIQLKNGHTIKLRKLVLSGSLARSLSIACKADGVNHQLSETLGARATDGSWLKQPASAVMRGIVVTTAPIRGQMDNVRLVLPPEACSNAAAINVWQCCVSMNACPRGVAVWYLSTPLYGSDGDGGLRSCVALLRASTHGSSVCTFSTEHATASSSERSDGMLHDTSDLSVLLACYYRQDCYTPSGCLPKNVVCCSLPTSECTVDGQAQQAEHLFGQLFPGHPFLQPMRVDVQDRNSSVDPLDAALQELELCN